MVQHIFDLSKVDTRAQGSITDYKAQQRVPVSDTLGRQYTLTTPVLGSVTYLYDSNSLISTIVTQVEGGRYFIESYIRNANDDISLITTTSSFWTAYA